MTNKDKYIKFCEKNNDLTLFYQPWWLDAVCGEENWNVVLVEKKDEIIAFWPYQIQKKYFFRISKMPYFTLMLGPWIKYHNNMKYTNMISHEHKIIKELLSLMPKSDIFMQHCHYNMTDWLPMVWQNYFVTPKVSYVIDDLSNLDNIFSEFRSNIKTDIRKAQKNLKVIESDDLEKFYGINSLSFIRQGKKINYPFSVLKKIDDVCKERNCRKILFAVDEDERIHSVAYFIWDQKSAYYLAGGGDPSLRNSGSTSLLIWEAIQKLSQETNQFDFLGSKLESVERFNRSFGAKRKNIFTLYKANSFFSKIALAGLLHFRK